MIHRLDMRASMLAAMALLVSACASAPKPGPAAGPVATPAPAQTSAPATPTSAQFKPDSDLKICPSITLNRAPPTDTDRRILQFKPFVKAAPNVLLALVPVNGACLTSSFGPRGDKLHKGIDLQSRPPNMVHAAAKGRVLEAGFRDDYGNQVVIDHGQGVFTRYAHLKALEPGVEMGKDIPFGTPLGAMGASAGYPIPFHLHYEVLTGDYNTPKKSFGLTTVDPMALPPAQ
jgi:murein DD-endopeptidase MepM/ murein hydrolase activator NlpD